jgi:hypothetical protein
MAAGIWHRLVLLVAMILLTGCSAAAARSCEEIAGRARAATYVAQCLQVSPATHPPCNAANTCEMIQAEIRRGCALLETGAPQFCKASASSDYR